MPFSQAIRLDRILGCMVGGAVGDALGYPVEFLNMNAIRIKYGRRGITRYTMNDNGIAEISDDTQMSLFTANGLLYGSTQFFMRGVGGTVESYIEMAYREWYRTQTGYKTNYKHYYYCWLRDVPELNSRRAPGTTCMSALQALHEKREVRNNSKGCGGVMRVSPVSLYPFDRIGVGEDAHWHDGCGSVKNAPDIARLGADTAKITHKHPLGFLPAGLMAYIVYRIVYCPAADFPGLEEIVEEALEMLTGKDYPEEEAYLKNLVRLAVQLSKEAGDDVAAISSLGEGWTGEEAFAIAVYCSLKYRNDFEKAVVAAVNHSGDSDSTGAIAGNLMGALLGRQAIPDYYTNRLELLPVIEEIAHDLFTGCIIDEYTERDTPEKQHWYEKYGNVKEYMPENE